MQEVIQEKDLFRGYEVRNWNFSPRIYKILALSAIFNVLALIVFAQTNLLTKKGCDSPFVSTVCQVLDTVYVGNKLFGTDSDYVVKEYNKTEIGEDDEITMIDVGNVTPPLSYPANYFAISNPDQFHLDENGKSVQNDAFNSFENMTPPMNSINPTFPNNQPPLINSTPNLPPPNNNPMTGTPPDSPWEVVNTPPVNNPTLGNKGRKSRKGGKNPTLSNDSPNELTKPDGDETADKDKESKIDEKTSKNSDPVKAVETNKKPINDLTDFVLAKSVTNNYKVDLKPFKVMLDGRLVKKEVKDEKGEIKEVVKFDPDPKKTRWNLKEEAGDKEMVELAREAIEAVGDSGFLGYLYNFGAENIQITLQQVDDKVVAVVKSDMKTEQKAQTMASGLGVFMAGAKIGLKTDDEKALMNSAKSPTSDGKFFIIQVEMTKDQAQDMIQRNLMEAAKKKLQEKQPNSTAQTLNTNSNTGK